MWGSGSRKCLQLISRILAKKIGQRYDKMIKASQSKVVPTTNRVVKAPAGPRW